MRSVKFSFLSLAEAFCFLGLNIHTSVLPFSEVNTTNVPDFDQIEVIIALKVFQSPAWQSLTFLGLWGRLAINNCTFLLIHGFKKVISSIYQGFQTDETK